MSSQDTQVNTISGIFLLKNKSNCGDEFYTHAYLRTCREAPAK